MIGIKDSAWNEPPSKVKENRWEEKSRPNISLLTEKDEK